MDKEEETQKCNSSVDAGNIGNIGRSSKKQKQRKVPQRGLGVAQLEKIRLEEQQKKDGSINLRSPPPIVSSPLKSNSNSNHSLPIPNNQSYSSSSSIPYPSDNITSPNSILWPQNIDVFNSNNSLGWQSVSVQGHGMNLPKIWNSCHDYNNHEKESCGVDNPGLAFRSTFNVPIESIPIRPLPSLMQRVQYHQQSPPPAAMVNVSSSTSSSSALPTLHMELPSNQNYYGKYSPVWPEEEKMVGMKRPYPCSLDNPPCPAFHCNFPPAFHPIGRSDESISLGNGATFNFTPSNLNFREGPSYSDSVTDPTSNSKRSIKETAAFIGDFLTLAPPTTTLTCSSSKLNCPSAYLTVHKCETFDFDSLPYQGRTEDPIIEPGSSVADQLQPCYTFLPPAIMQIGQATKTSSNFTGGEVGESVDLNLKL